CFQVEPSKDRRLPDRIFKLFRGQNEQEVINILKRAQDKEDEIWPLNG
ncbi:unnamed protein product, partial [Rotaria sordida]